MALVEPKTKVCSVCFVRKSIEKYYRHHNGKYLHSQCKRCHGKQTSKWAQKNKARKKKMNNLWRARNRQRLRDANRKYKYGVSPEVYAAMLNEQAGVCAICKKSETKKVSGITAALSVDHNHETGKVRGLLCLHCNLLVGRCKEKLDVLIAAIDYLKQHRG